MPKLDPLERDRAFLDHLLECREHGADALGDVHHFDDDRQLTAKGEDVVEVDLVMGAETFDAAKDARAGDPFAPEQLDDREIERPAVPLRILSDEDTQETAFDERRIAEHRTPEVAVLMRIYLSEGPLFRRLVEALFLDGFRGATVFRGIEGFGRRRRLSSARLIDAVGQLPILIEVLDEAERIMAFLPALETLLDEGLVTLERVARVTWKPGRLPIS